MVRTGTGFTDMLWHDGLISEAGTLTLAAGDRGLLLADGLFETLLVVGGRPWRLDDHLARLERSAAAIGMPVDERPRQAVTALASHALGDGKMQGLGAIRVTITRGTGPRGLKLPPNPLPGVFATLAPWQSSMAFQPVRLHLSTIRRNEYSPLSRMKSLSYLDNVLALEAAVQKGYDDALLTNTGGRVAATSAGNVFALVGANLVTPPVSDGVLPGITRQAVLEVARASGLAVREQSLTVAKLKAADGAFATNSLRLISPIVALDGEAIARDARTALLIEALQADITADCGCDPFATADKPHQLL